MQSTRKRKKGRQKGSQGAGAATPTRAQIIIDASRRWKVPLWVLVGVKLLETGPDSGEGETSSAGAQGPFQFMPGTAASLGIKDPNNFFEAANGSARYLAQLKKQAGSWNGALEGYNAGPGNIGKGIGYTEKDAKAALRENGLGRLASTSQNVSWLGDAANAYRNELEGLFDVHSPKLPQFPGNPALESNPLIPGAGGSDPLSSLRDISTLINLLTDITVWLRLGEVLAGAVLIYLALKELTGTGASDLPGYGVARAAAKL